jgi:large subunit ribosomal protein L21
MFAVIAQGGKQYRVEPGDVLEIERIPSLENPEKNSKIELTDVRAVGGEGGELKLGNPSLAGAKVLATLVREMRGNKILVFKKKKRKSFKKRRGHRQDLLEIRIDSISA